MTQEEILQYKKRCSKFLGFKYHEGSEYWTTTLWGGAGFTLHQMKFHSDWNWIMEIINKIEDVATIGQRVYFKIEPYEISVYCSGVTEKKLCVLYFKLNGRHFNGDKKKEAVVEAINQFLIWYENK